MSQNISNIGSPANAGKARAVKGKAPGQTVPVRRFPQAAARQVVTFETAARICPTAGMAARMVTRFGLEEVDYDAVRSVTKDQMIAGAEALRVNLNDKALEMHMQRIVDAYVRSAHGAGTFYDTKAKTAQDLASAISNEDRDEDRPGVDGTANKAERAADFAANVGLQAFALLAAADGALDAYHHAIGKEWKPYEGATAMQGVARQAIAERLGAFDRT